MNKITTVHLRGNIPSFIYISDGKLGGCQGARYSGIGTWGVLHHFVTDIVGHAVREDAIATN